MLKDLIDAHKAAAAAFDKCCEALDDKHDAYHKATESNLIRVELYEATPCVNEGLAWLRGCADLIVDKFGRQIPMVKKLSPEFLGQFEAFIATARGNLYKNIDDAIEQEERRKFEFGLTAIQDEWERLNAAETKTIEAIASHRCADHVEERERIAYLFGINADRIEIDYIAQLLAEAVGGEPLQHVEAQHDRWH